MQSVFRIYRVLNLLSIDVALGAVAGALFFARVFSVHVMPQGFLALGLTVWCIYTADHLLDAWTIKHTASTARHRLHQEKFQLMFVLLIIALVVDICLALMVRTQILQAGLILGLISGIYLLLSRKLLVFKELVASILYTAGVLLPVWAIYSGDVPGRQIVVVAEFAAIVFINILLFALLSHSEDVEDRQPSIVIRLGRRFTTSLLVFMFALVFALVGMNIGRDNWFQQSIILVMNTMLLLIFLFPNYFRQHDRFRLLGDAVFLFPTLIVVL